MRRPAGEAGGQRAPASAPARGGWRRIGLQALAMWAATRLAFVLLTYFAFTLSQYTGRRPPGGLLETWDQWDTHWYLLISRLGYFKVEAANFFPLYPTLVGGLSALLGHASGPVWPAPDSVRLGSALALSNLFALAAFVGLGLLAAGEASAEAAAWPAIRVAAAYPFALFLAAGYAESLFLALAAFTLLFARRGSWAPMAATAFAAGLARPIAVILVLPILYEHVRRNGRGLASLFGGAVLAASPLLGTACYAAYLWAHFHDPLLFLHTQQRFWHHQLWPLWRTAAAALGHLAARRAGLLPVDLAAVLGFGLLTLVSARRAPVSFTLYMAGLLYVSVSSPIPEQNDLIPSAGRYLTASLPCFLVLGRWTAARPWLDLLVVSAGFMLQAVLATSFLSGGPVL